ncbi:hypothetical protein AB0M32_38045 [Streptomyces sp. NPDC051985]|uniref:hypothetical protein n=1 Tax=Streptomyces sp. NPDC051985 TaxID=3155807 RepID=UPI0034182EBB
MSGNRHDERPEQDTYPGRVSDNARGGAQTPPEGTDAPDSAVDRPLDRAEDAALDALLMRTGEALDHAIEARSQHPTPGALPVPDPEPVQVNWQDALGDRTPPPWLWPAGARIRRRKDLLRYAYKLEGYQAQAAITAEYAFDVNDMFLELRQSMSLARAAEFPTARHLWDRSFDLAVSLWEFTIEATLSYIDFTKALLRAPNLVLPDQEPTALWLSAACEDVWRCLREIRADHDGRDGIAALKRYSYHLDMLQGREELLANCVAIDYDYYGSSATALATSAGLLRGASRNFCRADLRHVKLEDVPLQGVCWSAETRWPTPWQDRVRYASVSVGRGQYMIVAEPADAPVPTMA